MRVTLFDGLSDHPMSEQVGATLNRVSALHAHHRLTGEALAPCQGCFECWLRHPGACKARDAGNRLMADLVASDVALWLTQVHMGSWAGQTKIAIDKMIGLMSPFFRVVEGETHHRRRYERLPRWGVLALHEPHITAEHRLAFEQLVARTALNLDGGVPWVSWLDPAASPDALREHLRQGFAHLQLTEPAPPPPLDPPVPSVGTRGVRPEHLRPRHVALWVGSGKPQGPSTSESLGSALVQRLVDRGWTQEMLHISRSVRRHRSDNPRLTESAARADLLIIATPVYVDTLPGLLQLGLEQLVALSSHPTPTVLGITQSGFPELSHNRLAIDTLRRFALESGMPWAGHLSMGGGQALNGRPLDETGATYRNQRAALDEVAEALHTGDGVPETAAEQFALPTMPAALYRAAGSASWLARSWTAGGLWNLHDRPFETQDS